MACLEVWKRLQIAVRQEETSTAQSQYDDAQSPITTQKLDRHE